MKRRMERVNHKRKIVLLIGTFSFYTIFIEIIVGDDGGPRYLTEHFGQMDFSRSLHQVTF